MGNRFVFFSLFVVFLLVIGMLFNRLIVVVFLVFEDEDEMIFIMV